jgi:hypothetical protein
MIAPAAQMPEPRTTALSRSDSFLARRDLSMPCSRRLRFCSMVSAAENFRSTCGLSVRHTVQQTTRSSSHTARWTANRHQTVLASGLTFSFRHSTIKPSRKTVLFGTFGDLWQQSAAFSCRRTSALLRAPLNSGKTLEYQFFPQPNSRETVDTCCASWRPLWAKSQFGAFRSTRQLPFHPAPRSAAGGQAFLWLP